MNHLPDITNCPSALRDLADQDQRDADMLELEEVEREIVESIVTTGSYSWGRQPYQTIGHQDVVEALDYFAVITASQPRNHTIAGTLLSIAIREAAETVAKSHASLVLKDQRAAASLARQMQRAGV